MRFTISPTPIDPAPARAALENVRAGAFVTFEGRVRVRNEERDVGALEYEAFAPLAEKEGMKILEEARARYAILDAACIHRAGRLLPGDLAIWVAVAAEHRGPAFEACRYIVDEAKTRVPIWKKEHYVGGSTEWIHSAGGPGAASPGA
jgi:molybdopterin synthase catalytic subunit